MKKNVLKMLCALLALLLTAAPALAAQQPPLDTLIALTGDHTTTPGDVAITQVEIKGLDAPRVGIPLQSTALAKANNGIMWALPVIWADLDGNIITQAKAGETCLPFIAFYVPTGYHLEGVDLKNLVNVTLPRWLSSGNLYFLDAPSIGVTFIAMGYKTNEVTVEHHHDDDDEDEPVEIIDWPEPEQKGDLELCRRYAEDPVIEKYGAETLTFLIELVKNTVQPHAVNALREALPSFRHAEEDDELGEEVSVRFIDYDAEDPAAVFTCTHNDEGQMVYRMDINVDAFAVLDETTGEYIFDESSRSKLDSVVTGEMLHAFMVDYTRNGMYGQLPDGTYSDENAFPQWFVLGMSTLVEDNYALRYDEFIALADSDDLTYTPESLAENARSLDKSIYGSGYLAAVYLSAMAADDVTEFENAHLRKGMNSLLERLHGGESLDAIIRDIAPKDDDGEPIYDGLEDFTQKFMTDDISTDFCAIYLNRLEEASEDEPATGNILKEVDDPGQPAEGAVENPGAYQLTDNKDYAISTVDEAESLKTGGALYGYDPETGEIIEPEGDAPDEEEEDEAEDETEDETGDENEDETGDETEDETGDETEDETGDETEDETGDETEDETGDESEEAPAGESGDNSPESQDTDTDDNQNQQFQKVELDLNAMMEPFVATHDASASEEELITYAIMASYSDSDDEQEEDDAEQEEYDVEKEDFDAWQQDADDDQESEDE